MTANPMTRTDLTVLCLAVSMSIPRVINGRYAVVRPLGTGGQGATWVVRDLYQGEDVALKVIMHEFGPWQEAQILTALRDRHILPVRNADFVAGAKFLVTELARGGTVQDRITAQGQRGIEIPQALRWTRQACEGLLRTHATNLVHNDIKPANIFLDNVGEALLGDFGLALLMDSKGKTAAAGTFQTMAPEVAAELNVPGARPGSIASDIYSIGATLYWMIAGVPPYQPVAGLTVLQVAAAAAANVPVPIRDVAPHVPQSLGQRIAVAMAPNPADRYQSVSTLSTALGNMLAMSRDWIRTDECGVHWGCWRGIASGRSTVLLCAIPIGTSRYQLRAAKLPGQGQIRKAGRIVTHRQLAVALRAVMRECA